MKGNITIARSWSELNDWQFLEIAHLYLSSEESTFSDNYQRMISVLFQKKPGFLSRLKMWRLLSQVPMSVLGHFGEFLTTTTNFYKFPNIPGLIAPSHALGDITIKHFSTIDTFFYAWNNQKTILNLKRLVASIYRIKKDFDDLDLPAVDVITRKLPIKRMHAIALSYLFTRVLIADQFPIVFPKKKKSEDDDFRPVFKTKPADYTPFDKTILAMSMDELQPLGKKQDVNNVRIREFLSVLSESVLYHQRKAKAYEGK